MSHDSAIKLICDYIYEDLRWEGATEILDEKECHAILSSAWALCYQDHSMPLDISQKLPELSVSVVLANDDIVQNLNREYRKLDKPTNVLSFPQHNNWGEIIAEIKGLPEEVLLGDIIISYDTVQREAIAYQKDFRHYFLSLLVHGFLHLLGYDHIDDNEAQAMESLERKILASFKIPDPYAESER